MTRPKAYLFSYSPALGTREQIKECLDKIPQIQSWRTELPNAFFIISEAEVERLVDSIIECRGGNPRHASILIIEISNNKQGYLTKESWDFMNQRQQE